MWFQALLHAMPHDTPRDVRARALLGACAVTAVSPGKIKPEELQRYIEWLDEASYLYRELGDLEGIALSTIYHAVPAIHQQDFNLAQVILEEAFSIGRHLAHPQVSIIALRNLAGTAISQGNYEYASSLLKESLVLSQQTGNLIEAAIALSALGDVAFNQCNFLAARDYARQALELARHGGNNHIERIALTQKGEASRFLGDFQQARASFKDLYQLSLVTEDDYSLETALHLLGKVACEEGNYRQAFEFLAESLRVGRTREDWVTPFTLEWLATVAAGSGLFIRSARLFGAAEVLREVQHRPLPPDNVLEYKRHVAFARAQVDTAIFASAWSQGREMQLNQAIQYALADDRDLQTLMVS
jgi:tetratricopeptide (TPR) repeat protein